MSTIFTNYLFQQEQPIQATHSCSSLLKKTDDLFKSCNIQEQKLEKTSKDFRSFEASRKVLYKWHSKKKEHKQGKRYSIEFKQKVISEVYLSRYKNQVAKNHNICYRTLKNWMKKVSQPAESLSKTKEHHQEGRRYPLEFKQSVVSEICSGRRITEVSKNYNICQGTLRIWMKKAYALNLPYNSSAAWMLN
ncbi:hypothetical protein [Candidatus Rhabdochlamydia sp. T3358]|uniref:hypothetical protein n=1 Tax=Candidatus Rhabdochlamydia sp. T3358 TaxID=2099795 RepID=UPI0010B8C9E6|nr:hypothetical protein [Candidatus Rhabdochlamydia sp. T3358]VHO02407.1 Transposase [Candidatus Rhabdochlamydia sp. T3358]